MKIPKPLRRGVSGIALSSANIFQYPKKQILKLGSEIISQENAKDAYKKMFYLPFDKNDKYSLLSKKITDNVDLSTSIDEHIGKYPNLKDGAFSYYLKSWLSNDLLIKADKMGLAHALEVRVPFLDTDIVNFSCNLDHKYKQDRFLFRKTVKPMLPAKILKRGKQGFTLPISNWFIKKDFTSRLSHHFEDLSKRGLFNEPHLRKIINNPSAFRNDHRLWVLLNLELWCKIYLDKIPPKNIII